MSIQRLHVAKRYSEVVIHNGTIYLAGQLADDFDGDIDDVEILDHPRPPGAPATPPPSVESDDD